MKSYFFPFVFFAFFAFFAFGAFTFPPCFFFILKSFVILSAPNTGTSAFRAMANCVPTLGMILWDSNLISPSVPSPSP